MTGPGLTAPGQGERAPALRGLFLRAPENTLRSRTLQDLRDLDPGFPYRQEEAASRDIICSFMERQDRMNEAIVNRIVDREYWFSDPADDLNVVRAPPEEKP